MFLEGSKPIILQNRNVTYRKIEKCYCSSRMFMLGPCIVWQSNGKKRVNWSRKWNRDRWQIVDVRKWARNKTAFDCVGSFKMTAIHKKSCSHFEANYLLFFFSKKLDMSHPCICSNIERTTLNGIRKHLIARRCLRNKENQPPT